MKRERKEFKVSKAIVRHLIESQAGSVSKALLEAVMNSVDAKATTVKIWTEGERSMVIEDDGRGFRTAQEVEKYFEIFGSEHASEEEQAMERQFGTFGLGRGQIMAFAKTHWESNQFEMWVDIRKNGEGGDGLQFDQVEHPEPRVGGCRITATFYEPLSKLEMHATIDEIKKHTRYAPVAIELDGRRINSDVDSVAWTTVTDEFYFKENQRSQGGIEVYNLGVYVCDYPHWRMGVSGVLVSRTGHPFALNMARNDVLVGKCRVWRKAKRLLGEEKKVRRATGRMSDEDRKAIARELAWEEARPADFGKRRILKTINGSAMSPYQMANHANARVCIAPDAHSQIGERIHNERAAAVLSPEVLDWYGEEDVAGLVAKLNRIFGGKASISWRRFTAVEFDETAKMFSQTHRIIEKKLWTKTERAAVKALQLMSGCLYYETKGYAEKPAADTPYSGREIRVGSSGHAQGWTDGHSYIAVDRKYLAEHLARGANGWMSLMLLLVHEYMHGDADTVDHVHGHEFYQGMHDYLRRDEFRGIEIVMKGHEKYRRERKKLGLEDTKRMALQMDRVERAFGERVETLAGQAA